MIIIKVFIILLMLGFILIPFMQLKGKGIVSFSVILVNALLSSYLAIQCLAGEKLEFILPGSYITGLIPLRIDALSAWFMLIINFVFLTGNFYGLSYMKAYKAQKNNISLHAIAMLILHASLISLCVIQNSFVFLIAWEGMALSAFILIIFEHEKTATIKAGINYLIQSHISIVFLMIAFIWIAIKKGSYDFNAITAYTIENHPMALLLFIFFLIAFAIKAGFVPFHTWLPYAHPAAPAHISGIMSGVIIKIGIFGILRMLLVVKPDFITTGYIILIISVISGLYGVMLAIIQHNLKKLLAYHSIENIGIIGIGIGTGCIGLGSNNQLLAGLGFAGALLHTLNHALFKSLLFYTAGIVYQATHDLDIEHLGGLIKKMPQTAILFLIAAIAICGIPPFNGFISEFLIYSGLYQWMQHALLFSSIAIIFTVLGLVLIGGLAMLCFTKAFSIVFLGNARKNFSHEIKEPPFIELLPLYFIALFIVMIGVFPLQFIQFLSHTVLLFTANISPSVNTLDLNIFQVLQPISFAMWGLVLLIVCLFFLRKFILSSRKDSIQPSWGCAYNAPTVKLQYTANSFVRPYRKLFRPFLLLFKIQKDTNGIFPEKAHYNTHPYDKIEQYLIDNPIKAFKSFLSRFLFLQNGKLQFYILYGIIFIVSIICIPLFYEQVIRFIEFLKQL
ncbi:MAG: proton-conducting transporter membrane subunit [Bacteroidetes bacterium]|nr:proton-conducting transporter membrane subunit [Bacteroidota bacterium]